LNPIEEFFSKLKAVARAHWTSIEEDLRPEFGVSLEWCVDVVGARVKTAEGHFRHANIVVEPIAIPIPS